MQTIHEEGDEDTQLSLTAVGVSQPWLTATALRRTGPGSSGRAAGGALRASTPSAGLHPVRPRTQQQPRATDAGELDLNVTGAKITKAPASILQNAHETTPPAAEGHDAGRLAGSVANRRSAPDARSSSPSEGKPTGDDPRGTLADNQALKQAVLKRKRARARRQKVTFVGACAGKDKDLFDGPGAQKSAAIPPPAVYMPAYVPKSKSRSQLRQFRVGGDCGAREASFGDEEEFLALTGNKPLTAREPDEAVIAQDSSAEADGEALNMSKTELRQQVSSAIRQIRPTVLKHILLRNKLVDGSTQLNLLPQANLVAMIISSHYATRELLRGAYLQNAGGGSLVMDRKGVSSLGKYKKFVEDEATPRPVSDAYNPTVVAGPGLFHRNRFPPGVTALERLTWWEREADKIAKEYEQTFSAKETKRGKLPQLEGWTNPVEGQTKTFVMFDDRYRMKRIRDRSPEKLKTAHDGQRQQGGYLQPYEQMEAVREAIEAERELALAIDMANTARDKFSLAQARSNVATRPQTSLSMAGQRIDTAIRHAGTRSSWPHASGHLRTNSRGDDIDDGVNGIDAAEQKNVASRPATEPYSIRQRSASVDPETMSRGRDEDNQQLVHGTRGPMRYRVKDEDLRHGALSPSKFIAGGEFCPEYPAKNTFTGGRRGSCIKAGLPYEDNTFDHLNSLLLQKTPHGVGNREQSQLPPHLLAMRNLGTKRWRKAYERGQTEYIPGMAQVNQHLIQIHPRDSRIFDLWGADQKPPPPEAPPIDPPYTQDPKQSMKQRHFMHTLGEMEVRESGLYSFGSVLHPQNNMVSLVHPCRGSLH
jgi:hypothetical protein